QQVVGQLSSAADAARRLVLSAARELDVLRAASGPEARAEARRAAFREAALGVFRVQQILPGIVLNATTELFEVGGASAVGLGFGLDRHWRNARTLASHNPARQRARSVGEYELNGTFATWGREHTPTGAGAPARE
ncbi:MAG: acyl-CoA dehydrogenase family protein, partial [Solirubrobacteraceae bacterium]